MNPPQLFMVANDLSVRKQVNNASALSELSVLSFPNLMTVSQEFP